MTEQTKVGQFSSNALTDIGAKDGSAESAKDPHKQRRLVWGTRLSLFRQWFVVVADDSGDRPLPVLVSPDLYEFRFPHVISVSGVAEPMSSNLDRTIVVQGIDLQRSGHEFP